MERQASTTDDRSESGIGTILVRTLAEIPSVLQDLNVGVSEIAVGAGLHPNVLANPDSVVSWSVAGQLVLECVKATGCEDFGLRVGARSGADSIGLTGLVAINAPTVRDALEIIMSSLKVSQTGSTLALDVRDDDAILSFGLVSREIESADHISDGAIAMAFNIMRQLCGPDWRANRIMLPRACPQDPQPFSDFFGAPVVFKSPHAALVFGSERLAGKNPGANPRHYEILLPILVKALGEAPLSFSHELKSILRAEIVRAPLTLSRAAAALGLSDRTFSRRLEQIGLTFSDLADEVKFETARNMLRSDLKINEVAQAVGFSETSAFTRAFERWSGQSPSEWRAENRTMRAAPK
jgi:AraC-like DNA-binding protein